MRQAGATDQEAHEAAVAAVQTVLPLAWKEASAEAVNAVAYATRHYPEWFWRGAPAHKEVEGNGALAGELPAAASTQRDTCRRPLPEASRTSREVVGLVTVSEAD
jgi:hypothetical protein